MALVIASRIRRASREKTVPLKVTTRNVPVLGDRVHQQPNLR